MFLYELFNSKSINEKIDESKKRILKYDSLNKIDLADLKDFKERYENLDLTREQRFFINDYIALLESIKEYDSTISYFAGFFDAVKIVKKNKNT